MQVEVLVNLGSNDYPDHPYLAGDIHEVSDVVGRSMVARGHARVFIEDEQEPVIVQLIEQSAPEIATPEPAIVSQDIKQDKPAKAALKTSKEK